MNLVQPLVLFFVIWLSFYFMRQCSAHVQNTEGGLKWKKLMTNLKKPRFQAFTLVGCWVVLLIISVLLLLFIAPIWPTKDAVDDKTAVVKVVESQAELYRLDKMMMPTSANYKRTVVSQLSKLKLIKTTMQKQKTSQTVAIKAFTMFWKPLGFWDLWSLLWLYQVQSSPFAAVEEQIFFLEVEELYQGAAKTQCCWVSKKQSELRWMDRPLAMAVKG